MVTEQEKLSRADAVIVQFPLWSFGMPAILKGWFDRIFVNGFAFGKDVETGQRLRYEQGPFTGKRALVAVTLGTVLLRSALEGKAERSMSCCSAFCTALSPTPG